MSIDDEPVQAWRCKNQIPGCQEAAAALFRQRLSEILRGPESTRQPVDRVGTCEPDIKKAQLNVIGKIKIDDVQLLEPSFLDEVTCTSTCRRRQQR
jgi:hypothetical protein